MQAQVALPAGSAGLYAAAVSRLSLLVLWTLAWTPAAALASAGEAARRYCLEGYETGEVLKRAVPVVETDGAVVLAGRCLR